MGLIQKLKDLLYSLVVRSGVILAIIPLMKPFISKIGPKMIDSNHTVTDRKGNTIRMTQVRGRVFPPMGANQISGVKRLEIREGDVLLCGYPKTGAHWVHEILHMLVTGKAEATKYGKEFGGMIDAMPTVFMDSLPSPRVLNSHFIFEDLPDQIRTKKTKIIYTYRNPKDTVVSFYNHYMGFRFLYEYEGEFDDFVELFIDGKLEYGCYFEHLLDWDRQVKTNSNNPILPVRFEDLKGKTKETIRQMADFLEVPATDQFIDEVVEASNFRSLKEKRKDDPLQKTMYRKGIVGDWKNWLKDEQAATLDKLFKEKLEGTCYHQS